MPQEGVSSSSIDLECRSFAKQSCSCKLIATVCFLFASSWCLGSSAHLVYLLLTISA